MGPQLDAMLKDGEACHDIQEFLSFFANRGRLRILCCLAMKECSVQELEEATDLRQSLVSQNLRSLRLGGLVERRRDGNRSIYSISNPFVSEMMMFLADLAPRMLAEEQES